LSSESNNLSERHFVENIGQRWLIGFISIEGGIDSVTPQPVLATPEPSTPEQGAIAPGAIVVTNDANVAMRSAPSTIATVVLELEQGMTLTVIGPSVEGDGFVWWLVIDPETQTVGYVREELLSPSAGS
jgi:Bacterial SH3 domain